MLIVADPAREVVGTAGVLGGRVLCLDSEPRLEAAVRLYQGYELPDYNNRNPRAEIWMELRLALGRS